MLLGFKRVWVVLTVLILIGGIVPLFHYWYYIGRVPSVMPLEAEELLTTGSNVVLIDVRGPEEFKERHLDGAENWPYEEIMALSRNDTLPERFKGKTLLLVCDGGVLSASATQKLRGQFGADAFNVMGGLQAWIASTGERGVEVLFRSASGEGLPPPSKESPLGEQLALVSAILIIKPLYMLITLFLVLLLWRLKSPDIVALRWGLSFFFVGESFCALNIILFNHGLPLFEFFHMYGMVLSFGFVTYAILEALDLRILGYSDPQKRCALLGLCRQCIKYGEASCGLQRVFYFLIPALAVLAFIPLLVSINAVSYNTKVFGIFLNYSHPVIYQVFEFRYAPIYAIALFFTSLLVLLLLKGKMTPALKLLFAAAIGPLGLAFLRLIFFSFYRDNLVWFNFWEESTELIYVSGIGFILWVFRSGLFQAKEKPGIADVKGAISV